MAKITIIRLKQTDHQTTGILWVKPFFFCRTLELPRKDNQRNISCIPPGDYQAKRNIGRGIITIRDVPGRSGIQIHAGNTFHDIKGCIIVGIGEKDINRDGVIDVTQSKKAIRKILSRVPEKFSIKIVGII